MPNYRRVWCPAGIYFFTVNLYNRQRNDLLVRHIELLRASVQKVKQRHPFYIHGWVVLPDHLHCVIELPENDTDFSLRWRLIKMEFSKGLPPLEKISPNRHKRGERGIWQRRFWEHLIRDEADYLAHMDYIHINPLKHGLVKCVVDWPYSTFHKLVQQNIYEPNWAGGRETVLTYTD